MLTFSQALSILAAYSAASEEREVTPPETKVYVAVVEFVAARLGFEGNLEAQELLVEFYWHGDETLDDMVCYVLEWLS